MLLEWLKYLLLNFFCIVYIIIIFDHLCFLDKFMFIAMFNLFPITTTKMTMATNDMPMQNMLLLTNNFLPHKTCSKLRGKIFNKGANFYLFLLQHMVHQPW